MKLFPASASPDALMRAVISAFEAPSHQPLSRSEEQRQDGFTSLCCELARDSAEVLGGRFEEWLDKHWSDENVRWYFNACWLGDEDDARHAKDALIADFLTDCAGDYADDAREKMEERDENY